MRPHLGCVSGHHLETFGKFKESSDNWLNLGENITRLYLLTSYQNPG